MKIPKRESICLVLLVVSVIVLLSIAFGASKPPARVPIFIANGVLIVPAIILGSTRQRILGCILLAVVLFLAEEEYSAGQTKH